MELRAEDGLCDRRSILGGDCRRQRGRETGPDDGALRSQRSVGPASAGDGSFAAVRNFLVGSGPEAVGDWRPEPGRPARRGFHQLQPTARCPVLLGRAGGGLRRKTDFPVGSGAIAVAVGDINQDGMPDVVAANYYDNKLSVLLGTGTGGLSAKTDLATGSGPMSVAFGGRQWRWDSGPGVGELQRRHGVGAPRDRDGRLRTEDGPCDGFAARTTFLWRTSTGWRRGPGVGQLGDATASVRLGLAAR